MREFIVSDTILKDERFQSLILTIPFEAALGVWLKALILYSHSPSRSLSLVQWNLNNLPQSLVDVGLFAVLADRIEMVEPAHVRFEDEVISKERKSRMKPDELVQIWNEFSGSLPKVKTMTPDRKAKAMARIKECDDRNTWIAVVKYLSSSSWHTGKNDRKWKADFKYLLRPGIWAEISERLDEKSEGTTFGAW